MKKVTVAGAWQQYFKEHFIDDFDPPRYVALAWDLFLSGMRAGTDLLSVRSKSRGVQAAANEIFAEIDDECEAADDEMQDEVFARFDEMYERLMDGMNEFDRKIANEIVNDHRQS